MCNWVVQLTRRTVLQGVVLWADDFTQCPQCHLSLLCHTHALVVMEVVPTSQTLSVIFDSVFEMDNSRSDIDQLVREMTMEAAGEISPKEPK